MKRFIATLIERYQSILEHASLSADEQEETRARLNSLRLAESVLEKLHLLDSYPQQPLQIGVLGPTQAGKSTLNNLLLGTDTAGVSALAGYTVHAQGFVTGDLRAEHHLNDVLAGMFPGYRQTPQLQLDPENYRQYSMTANGATNPQLQNYLQAHVPTQPGTRLPLPSEPIAKSVAEPVVIWDSPDFDSIESGGYRTAVLRVAALSDVVVLMLSKDKYADRSVWDMMKLLAPLDKPTVYVINKLNPEDLQAVSDSFRNRYHENIGPDTAGHDPNISIVALPYIRGLDDMASALMNSGADELFKEIAEAAGRSNRATAHASAKQLIDTHWHSWLEPVQRELSAHEEWQERVDTEIDLALQSYRSSYLDHPQKYDTFNRAIAELLTLLEIPGLAGTLTATRNVVTWPIRTLFGLGQNLIGDGSAAAAQDHEKETLMRVQQKVVSELQNLTMDKGNGDNSDWWLELNRTMRRDQQPLQDSYSGQIDSYQAAFQPEIENAAQSLYKTLQKQPAVLNGLRAARVTTDAAAVVLAVKSGGLAASDLLIAPAMLSVTSMLTEGAIGKYMDSVKSQLKKKQLEQVEDLLKQQLAPQLKQLGTTIEGDCVFGFDQSDIEQARQQLTAFEQGAAA